MLAVPGGVVCPATGRLAALRGSHIVELPDVEPGRRTLDYEKILAYSSYPFGEAAVRRWCLLMTTVAAIALVGCVKSTHSVETPRTTLPCQRLEVYRHFLKLSSVIEGGSVDPHWLPDGSSFWYLEGTPSDGVIWHVDAQANTKTPLFDSARLRTALSDALGHEPTLSGLSFANLTLVEGKNAAEFTVENRRFVLDLATYRLTLLPASKVHRNALVPQIARRGGHGIGAQYDLEETLSPDGKWLLGIQEHNLWMRSAKGSPVQITTDGKQDYDWGYSEGYSTNWAWWSPDSSKVAALKRDVRGTQKIPVVHWLISPEEAEWIPYPRAGTPLPQFEFYILDVRSKRRVRVDVGDEPDQFVRVVGWRSEDALWFQLIDRRSKTLKLMVANPRTGKTRVVITERPDTLVHRWHGLFTGLDGGRFLWLSERDGWYQLYLYESDGTLLKQLTDGASPVVRVAAVDDENGWVYYTGHGDRHRPYDVHLYRIRSDGSGGRQRLTESTGEHEIDFAPSKKFYIDTHSTPVRPPTVELRNADGTQLRILSKANLEALTREIKWTPPEEFSVKAADGTTDLYGVLYKPYDFDPGKMYPVVERSIYTGRAIVPHGFSTTGNSLRSQAFAQLGFITFMVDARGTTGRGKVFEDATYGQVGGTEIADHVAVLKQLAATRPYMDLSRVGIVGHSAGGYDVLRAMLLYPETYQVGIALAAPADPLNQLFDDFEPLLGMPQENEQAYADASCLPLADRLRGKLLLIHGTSDTSAPVSHVLRMADALARADRPFDMLILPEQSHSFPTRRRYVRETIRRYFQEHLQPVACP